jgi:predicted CXXCH cytochrome family protein
MRVHKPDMILPALMLFVLSGEVRAAEDLKISPHSDTGDCSICHVASAYKLRGWFVFGSTKREMKPDLDQICMKCHAIGPNHAGGLFGLGIGHATGKKTAINRENLPLSSSGKVTCATTCHNVHVAPDDKQLYSKRLRMPVNTLCLSCHNM